MRAGESVVYTSSDERLVGAIVDWPADTPHVPSAVLQRLGISIAVHERFQAAGRAWTLVCGSPDGRRMVLPEPIAEWGLDLVRRLLTLRTPPVEALQIDTLPVEPRSEPLRGSTPALGAFILCMQPMFDLRTGMAHRAEALLRYDTPDEALTAWPQFSRNAALQTMANQWTIAQLLQHAPRWRDAHGIARVHLNVTSWDPSVLQPLLDALRAAAPFERSLLAIELAGTAQMDRSNVEYAIDAFADLGAETGIDLDEVTSANMLSLYGLPLSFVKIRADEAKYVAIETLPWDIYVTRAQTPLQWNDLRERGVRFAQGYALEPPLTIADFDNQLNSGRFSQRNPAADTAR